MTLSHIQFCNAVRSAAAIEAQFHGWPPKIRYGWLTEAELAARVRDALIHSGVVDSVFIKVQGSGRARKKAPRLPDLILGKDEVSIEVLYLYADAAPSPGRPLCDDLAWLNETTSRHVVAFLPRMRTGYRVNKHTTPYNTNHSPLTLAVGEHLLTDSLQMGGLNEFGQKLCNGVFRLIKKPRYGNRDRWTLDDVSAYASVGSIQRTTIGNFSDSLWALVWSHV